MISFTDRLLAIQQERNTRLCVGIDPDPEKLPKGYEWTRRCLFRFGRNIVDATAEFACAFKPNKGFWTAVGAEDALDLLVDYIHDKHGLLVLGDGKNGDIANSAKMYAREMFLRYNMDAATVNAYLGDDTLDPWLSFGPGRGIFVLCHTSNKGAGRLQELMLASGPSVFVEVARMVTGRVTPETACIGLVMGATFPEQIGELHGVIPSNTPLLIPGIGKQEGELRKTIQNCRRYPFIINSSSGIIHASQEMDFAAKAARAAQKQRDEINDALAAI